MRIHVRLLTAAAILLATFVWSYWTTWLELVEAWRSDPDYGHGFLVIPIAIAVCLQRRNELASKASREWAWAGLVLIAASFAMRTAAVVYYVKPLEGYSMIVWVAGLVCLLGGMRFMVSCLPSIGFLFFMVPLPYRLSLMLRLPLQHVSTTVSCWMLQFLGQPAFAEGNTILLHQHQLEVERACAGLRIFMGILALAFAVVIATRHIWWEKLVILASALPIALLVNSLRIVATGLCLHYAASEDNLKMIHDMAGWAMIPMAAVIFGVFVWYLGHFLRDVEQVDVRELIRTQNKLTVKH